MSIYKFHFKQTIVLEQQYKSSFFTPEFTFEFGCAVECVDFYQIP